MVIFDLFGPCPTTFEKKGIWVKKLKSVK